MEEKRLEELKLTQAQIEITMESFGITLNNLAVTMNNMCAAWKLLNEQLSLLEKKKNFKP